MAFRYYVGARARGIGGMGRVTRKRIYSQVAWVYDLLDLPFEYLRYRPIRRELFNGVGGAVLDAGVGTGRNMPFYPAGAEVVGIDLSPHMLARAARLEPLRAVPRYGVTSGTGARQTDM